MTARYWRRRNARLNRALIRNEHNRAALLAAQRRLGGTL